MLSTEEPQSFYSAFCCLLRCDSQTRAGPCAMQSMADEQQAPLAFTRSGHWPFSASLTDAAGADSAPGHSSLLNVALLLCCITALSVAPQARKGAAGTLAQAEQMSLIAQLHFWYPSCCARAVKTVKITRPSFLTLVAPTNLCISCCLHCFLRECIRNVLRCDTDCCVSLLEWHTLQ